MLIPGVSILQENLNYSPALSIVYKILPQILPQLQSYRCLLTRSLDPSFWHFLWWFVGGGGGEEHHSAKCSLQHTGGILGGYAPSEAGKFCIFETGIVPFGEYFWAQICSLQHTGGCLRRDVPPSEAGKFCIFETGIMPFGEYFGAQIWSR